MFVEVSEEVQREIDAARRDAESCFAEIVQWLTAANDGRRLWDVEEDLWKRVLALGRALLGLWFAARCPQSERCPVGCGPAAEFDQAGLLGVQLQSKFRHADA